MAKKSFLHFPIGHLMKETTVKKTQACIKCNREKVIKAKGLCNACYTSTCRETAKKKKMESEEDSEEEPQNGGTNMQEMVTLLLRKEEEIRTLQKLVETQQTLLLTKNGENTNELNKHQDNTMIQSLSENAMDSTNTPQKDLSTLFLEEKQTKVFEYDQERYNSYLKVTKQKGRWYGLGEEKLVELFPCFALLFKEYDEKILAKRSKWERDLMKEGKVEWRSLTETKGRVVTSAGQLFLLLQQIKPQKEERSVDITELFDPAKIKVYIQFMDELEKEPSTIRNLLLTLKFIIKQFLGTTTFQTHQQQMIATSTWLDIQCAFKKAQDFNKARANEEDLMMQGHFMEEQEFSLLVIYLLKRIHILGQVNNKSVMQVFEFQDLCYASIA
jgi:hypothetical protein